MALPPEPPGVPTTNTRVVYWSGYIWNRTRTPMVNRRPGAVFGDAVGKPVADRRATGAVGIETAVHHVPMRADDAWVVVGVPGDRVIEAVRNAESQRRKQGGAAEQLYGRGCAWRRSVSQGR